MEKFYFLIYLSFENQYLKIEYYDLTFANPKPVTRPT